MTTEIRFFALKSKKEKVLDGSIEVRTTTKISGKYGMRTCCSTNCEIPADKRPNENKCLQISDFIRIFQVFSRGWGSGSTAAASWKQKFRTERYCCAFDRVKGALDYRCVLDRVKRALDCRSHARRHYTKPSKKAKVFQGGRRDGTRRCRTGRHCVRVQLCPRILPKYASSRGA